jgi:hypothetical protein
MNQYMWWHSVTLQLCGNDICFLVASIMVFICGYCKLAVDIHLCSMLNITKTAPSSMDFSSSFRDSILLSFSLGLSQSRRQSHANPNGNSGTISRQQRQWHTDQPSQLHEDEATPTQAKPCHGLTASLT